MEPISDIYYPIIANANKYIEVDVDSNNDHDDYGIGINNDVVGLFSVSVYWRDTIRNILPQGSHGLIAVFENPCNPTFTYEINGPDVVFLGAGDFHDPKYNHMAMKATMDGFSDFAMKEASYSGIPINDEFCPFSLSIYPSV